MMVALLGTTCRLSPRARTAHRVDHSRCVLHRGRETEIASLVHRYYDPVTEQFLSVDPTINLTDQPYDYVGGDPINQSDRSGLSPKVTFAQLKKMARSVPIKCGPARNAALNNYWSAYSTFFAEVQTSVGNAGGSTPSNDEMAALIGGGAAGERASGTFKFLTCVTFSFAWCTQGPMYAEEHGLDLAADATESTVSGLGGSGDALVATGGDMTTTAAVSGGIDLTADAPDLLFLLISF